MFKPLHISAIAATFFLATSLHAQQAPVFTDAPDAPSADMQAYPAQPGDMQQQDAVDPPSRVARLSVIDGAVSFVPAGENDWSEAQLNRPLVTGDKLWTDHSARAELQIGAAAVRVDELSSFSFLNLDDNAAQVELTQGTLNLRVRRLFDGQTYEVDTPTLAFVINRAGEYRIDIAPDGSGTMVTAFHGGGDAYGEAGARFRVEEGQSVRFNDAQLRDYVSNAVPSPDDFDRFCFARDARWDNSPSRQFVSEEVIGYDDLDNNGSWDTNDADYGAVWYPTTVAAGWSPYSYGNWSWVGAYGWTWIDNAPWGFAPSHYGRWAYIRNRWGWCPGPVHVRPYYAPALVAFLGGRAGYGGPVGWFPLGPRDVYVPGYRVSERYFTRLNTYSGINSVTINNFYGNYARGNFDYGRINYGNRNIAGAITAVPGNVFVDSRPIRGSAVAVGRDTFANARVSGFATIAPTRDSLALRGGRSVAAPSQAVVTRNVIAATRPPAAVASFAQRQAQLQRDPARVINGAQLRSGAQNAIGNGQVVQRVAPASSNVRVVTANGVPARTGFPAMRGAAPDTALRAQQPERNAAPVVRNAPVLNNETVSRSINAPATERPPANVEQRTLPSTRYANPNNGDAVRVLRGNDGTPAVRSQPMPVQRDIQQSAPVTRPSVQEYRSAPVERAPQAPIQSQRVPQEYRQPQFNAPQQRAPVSRVPQQQEYRQAPQQQLRGQPQQDFRQPPQQQFRGPPPQQAMPVQRAPQQEIRQAPQVQFRGQPQQAAPQQNNQNQERAQPRGDRGDSRRDR